MIVTRRFPWKVVARIGLTIVLLSAAWAGVVFVLYAHAGMRFLRVPFLPIATIGTAVAFYVGFKNNASYERFWEGRKVWGGIVNASRTWATSVMSYVDPGDDAERTAQTRRRLIHRQLAWINALRLQLRKQSRFFDKPARPTRRRLENHAEVMRNDWDKEIAPFLDAEEFTELSARANPATHILTRQATDIAQLQRENRLDLFRQLDLMGVIEELYGLQGKCERIKNTPFPRQYAEFSRYFTRVFIFLIPFGMIDVFADSIDDAKTMLDTVFAIVPMLFASGLITWVFTTMEGIGDASEDPFERSMNDVPMNALCRTIEIDLREMLGETELPEKEPAVDNLLY